MNKTQKKHTLSQRIWAFLLAMVMVVGYIPTPATAQDSRAVSVVDKVSDTETHNRLNDFYGSDTYHSGKVTVDKSVSSESVDVDGTTFTPSSNENFIVTVSQAAQVMALTTQMATPVDVVFVIDTTGSMAATVTDNNNKNRTQTAVEVVNDTIEHLMAANENNRVGVVAFSAYNAGGVDAGGNAANILSGLAHYTGAAATEHLTWDYTAGQGPSWYSDCYLVRGRNADGSVGKGRAGTAGATNIQAGLATGASLLMNADTTVTIDGQEVKRMPFLILLSDGAPVASSSNNDWTNPSMTLSQGTNGDPLKAGNSFLPILVASYYKDKISQRYYPNNDGELSIYTIGFAVEADEVDMAAMTLNPKVELTNTDNDYQAAISEAWTSYANNESFSIEVGVPAELLNNNAYSHDGRYYFYHEDTQVNINQVNDVADNLTKYTAEQYYGVNRGNVTFEDNIEESIVPADKSISALAYNDGYYDATSADALQTAFESIFTEISKKSISAPTQVTTTEEFDGYVTFTDVIGEYMEVKDMKGILADGNYYQGRYAAQNIGSNGTDAAFDASLLNVLGTRLTMSSSGSVTAAGLLEAASTNNTYNGVKTQAYYNSATDYDNSIVWWGKTYNTDDGFEQGVQTLGHAVDDSIAYITDPNTVIPEGADVVCRSYFFYGTAGGTVTNANHDYLYFIVRVQRSLVAPYQQTVTISAPASLLSMEKVYITEDKTGDTTAYTVEVEKAAPARVIYEVGLRSDINEYNVDQIVGADAEYISEATNYANGQYYFYTNEWDRSESAAYHERAMSKATFYAADNNPYYTYQENTYLYDADGNILDGAAAPAGEAYYYRDVYTWGTEKNSDGELIATKSRELIKVNIPADAGIVKDETGWYIPAGTYTAAVISPDEDVLKSEAGHKTNTAVVVAHPHRTGDSSDAHYTVYLGNNGKLSLTSVKSKFVDVSKPGSSNLDGTTTAAAQITDADGKAVMVGDTLTYRINVANTSKEVVAATVTDVIPTGTVYVEGSAKVMNGDQEVTATVTVENGKITWTSFEVPAETTYEATFQVVVDESALSGTDTVEDVENTASIQLGNNPAYITNTVHNPPEGKKLVDSNGDEFAEGETVKVGDVLVYRIRYANDSDSTADVTITDTIPRGTTYVDGSASHGGALITDASGNLVLDSATGKPTLKWVIEDVQPHTSGVVSFRVVVDASAKADWDEGDTQPDAADTLIPIPNQAKIGIQIGENDPEYRYTNIPEINATVGNLKLSKVVESGDAQKEFKLVLTESGGKLDGIYKLTSSKNSEKTVEFVDGTATISIYGGEIIEIHGLPAGAKLTLDEDLNGMPGWSAEYSKTTLTIVNGTTEIEAAKVTNTYTAQPVKFQLKGVKSFEGENFPAGTFTFTAQEIETPADTVTISGEDYDPTVKASGISVTATATASQGQTEEVSFAFSERTFTEAFDRYYLITENATDINGVTADTKQYLLRLKVTDSGNGQLELTETLWERANADAAWQMVEGFTSETGKVTFQNKYVPKETSVTIAGTKSLSGRKLNANEFSFQLVDPISGDVIGTATNNEEGAFSFPAIIYTQADMAGAVDGADEDSYVEKTFTYYIREVVGSLANVTYDLTYYQVVVTVEDVNGKLEATTVINRFDATEGTDGSVTYPTEPSATGVEAIAYGNTYTTQDTQIVLSGTKTLSGDGAEGLAKDQFSFTIFEANEEFVIQDMNGDGKTEVSGASNAEDTNAEGGYVGGYTFAPIGYALRDLDGASAKTFYYVIQENIPATNGPTYDPYMVYDTSKYHVAVQVTHDSAKGTLTAEVVSVVNVKGGASQNATATTINFTNTKNKSTTDATPKGIKYTTGNELPAGLRFSFRVITLDGELVGTGMSAATAEEDGNNKAVEFTKLTYSHDDLAGETEKVFTYWIQESNVGSNNGVTYDTTRYKYVVTLKYNAETKTLSTSEAYYKLTSGDATDAVNYTTEITAADVVYNNVYNASTHVNLTAVKVLTGRDLIADEFDFRLQRLIDGKPSENAVNGTNNADGVVTFATLNYSTAMLDEEYKVSEGVYRYQYLMSEIEPADGLKIPGIDYSPAQYIVTIELKQAADGELTAELENVNIATKDAEGKYIAGEAVAFVQNSEDKNTYNISGAVFENTYSVDKGTSVNIVATKKLTGRDLVAGEFGFELFRKDGDEWVRTGAVTNTADKENNIIFTRHFNGNTLSMLAFDEDSDSDGDKEYTVTYRLEEIQNQIGGVTYGGATYWVKVTLEHVVAKSSYEVLSVKYYSDEACTDVKGEPATFENKYKAEDTSYTPVATKVLMQKVDGKYVSMTQSAGTYSFQVVELDPDNNYTIKQVPSGSQEIDAVVSTGNNAADGTVTFSPIGYQDKDNDTEADVYYYLIREVRGTDSTITYSDAIFYLKVTVTNDNEGGLTVTPVYYSDKFQTEIGQEAIQFTNYYGPGYIDLKLDLKKTVESDTSTINLVGSEYDFNVYEYVEGDSDYSDNTVITTGTNGATADGVAPISFGSIVIKKEQLTDKTGTTFRYAVVEVPLSGESDNGITIDDDPIIVTVTVTDDGYGNLTATYAYEQNDIADDQTFVNVYKADPAEIDLTAVKTLHNRELKAGDFTFQLKDSAGEVKQEKANAADGTVAFDKLTFTAPGIYTYTVVEKNEGKTGYTYDGTVYTVVITVTDDAKGKLHANVTYYKDYNTEADATNEPVGGISFVNSYTPSAIEVELTEQINAEKSVQNTSGAELKDKLAGFTFKVTDVSGNPVLDKNKQPITGTSQADGTIKFSAPFYFEHAGEYHYIITETGEKAGYVLDANTWSVYILVRYDSAKGELYIDEADILTYPTKASTQDTDAQAHTEQAPVFVNIYDPKPTTLTLKATKEITGRTLKDHEFTFHLMEGDLIVAEAKNKADGTIEFSITYTEPGEHTYVVHEHIPEEVLGGVTYDYATYTVKVSVTDPGNGELEAKVVEGNKDNIATFTNKYLTKGTSAKIEGTKHLVGKELAAQEFFFVLKDSNGKTIQTVQNKADGTFAFSELTYEAAGTYTYTVSEAAGTEAGMVYDDTVYTATVTVSDDGAGNLVAKVEYSNGGELTFENTYNKPAELVLSGIKTMDNAAPANGKFTFTLTDAKGNVIDEVTNTNGAFTFDKLTFAETGEFVYIVTETKGNDANVIYDETVYHVHVNVTLDEEKHEYVASHTIGIPSDEHTSKDTTEIVFANVTREEVKVHLHADKTLEDRHLKAGEFDFVLKDSKGDIVQTKSNAADGKVTFDALSFNAEGTYTYYISEVIPTGEDADKFMAYDSKEYKAVITVTAPDQAGANPNGPFEASVTYYLNNTQITGADFTNKPNNAPMSFSFKKVKENGDPLQGAEFTLTHVNCVDCILYSGEASYVATSDENGVVTFTNVPSGHQYLLSETKTPANYKTTADRHVTDIYGVVYIDGEPVVDTQDNMLQIVNIDAKHTEIILAGTKVMLDADGVQIPAENNAFTFNLYQIVEENGEKVEKRVDTQRNMTTAIAVQTVDVASEFIFRAISYDSVGTYEYVIREVDGDDPDVVYDENTYTVVVVVDQHADGTQDLYVKSVAVGKNGTEPTPVTPVDGVYHLEDVITFTNRKRTPATVDLAATKTVNENGKPIEIGDRVFTFYLKDEDGEILQTKQNDGTGAVSFDALTFDAAGTYNYTIVEQAGNDPYIDYDPNVYNVEIKVEADEASDGYKVTTTYTKGENTADSAKFINSLVDRGYAMLELLKLDEDDQPLEGVEFTLTHNCGEGCSAEIDAISATSRADGMVIISHIPSGHTYTLSETKTPDGYVPTGNRTVIVSYGEVTVDGAPFTVGTPVQVTNYYEGQVGIVGVKIQEGRELKEGDYSFALYATGADFAVGKNQQPIEAVPNKADGSFAFSALSYDTAGEYYYVVKEVEGTDPNVDYDPAEYYVTVTVTADDKTGELTPEVSVVKNAVLPSREDDVVRNDANQIVFYNVYVPSEPAVVEFSGTKKLTGRDIRNGEFTFVLMDASGNKLEEVKNVGTGFSFGKLTFAAAGTYEYKIAEVKGTDESINYDETIFDVVIKVVDNGKRKLVATTTITKAGESVEDVEFTNLYIPETAHVVFDGTKILEGRSLKAEEFSFQLKDAKGAVIETVKNGTNGKFAFSKINYTEAGVYTYTVNEVAGNAEGVTYDKTVYTVTVTVEDDLKGKLEAVAVITDKDGKTVDAISFVNTYDEPEKPSEPTEPEKPSEPTKPTEPEKPSEPTKPTEPEKPSEPTKPTEPEKPSEPTKPTEPEKPSEPTKPTEPEQPSEPTKPTEPEDPTEPGEPTEPEETTKPTEPTKPSESTKPTDPAKPTTPSKPTDNPKTGDDSGVALWSVTMIGSMLALAFMLILAMKPKGKYERR